MKPYIVQHTLNTTTVTVKQASGMIYQYIFDMALTDKQIDDVFNAQLPIHQELKGIRHFKLFIKAIENAWVVKSTAANDTSGITARALSQTYYLFKSLGMDANMASNCIIASKGITQSQRDLYLSLMTGSYVDTDLNLHVVDEGCTLISISQEPIILCSVPRYVMTIALKPATKEGNGE